MAKKNAAIEATDLPVGSPNLPRLVDVLDALGLISREELEAKIGLIIERYPAAELQLRQGKAFLDSKLTAGAIESIKNIVLVELAEAYKTGKSVIVHDPVDLA